MAIFQKAEFKQIKFGDFITTEVPPKLQPLTNRAVTLEYIPINNDYDTLKRFIDKEFYKLPSTAYTVKHDDRIDNLSYQFYKDPDYWWVLMMYNKLIDPFELGVETLSIPQASKLFLYLTRQRMKYKL
jgi:hypothetical protein